MKWTKLMTSAHAILDTSHFFFPWARKAAYLAMDAAPSGMLNELSHRLRDNNHCHGDKSRTRPYQRGSCRVLPRDKSARPVTPAMTRMCAVIKSIGLCVKRSITL